MSWIYGYNGPTGGSLKILLRIGGSIKQLPIVLGPLMFNLTLSSVLQHTSTAWCRPQGCRQLERPMAIDVHFDHIQQCEIYARYCEDTDAPCPTDGVGQHTIDGDEHGEDLRANDGSEECDGRSVGPEIAFQPG